MKQTFQHVCAFILCLAFCAALLPGNVWAAEIVDYGTCGDNLTWTLDCEGTLTISGTGELADTFWEHGNSIISVVISDGVTIIGNNVFSGLEKLKYVSIPETVTEIGAWAFAACKSLENIQIPKGVSYIWYWAFSDCVKLSDIYVDPENQYFTSIDGVLYNILHKP